MILGVLAAILVLFAGTMFAKQQNAALIDIQSQLNELQAKLLEPIILNDVEIGKISNWLGVQMKSLLKDEIDGLYKRVGAIATNKDQSELNSLQLKISELENEKLA